MSASPALNKAHHRQSSSLSDLSILELERHDDKDEVEIHVTDNIEKNDTLPMSSLLLVTETENLDKDNKDSSIILHDFVVESLDEDFTLDDGQFKVHKWMRERFYSDYIDMGLKWKAKHAASSSTAATVAATTEDKKPEQVVMLFESPSSSTTESTFHNKSKYRFHDWPPPTSTLSKSVLGPCRYGGMNGTALPMFLKDGKPPAGLEQHWALAIPKFKKPSYVDKITDKETVYAYLPVEQIKHHVNDPEVHYHLVGKVCFYWIFLMYIVYTPHTISFFSQLFTRTPST